ncbi:MAG: hypothetical protein R6X31_12910 [Anaerolineae bacterium]
MHKWRVIALAALAVLLLLAGLAALIVPEEHEGPEIYRIDGTYVIRSLDVVGAALLLAGCAVAWLAGLIWQRTTYDS